MNTYIQPTYAVADTILEDSQIGFSYKSLHLWAWGFVGVNIGNFPSEDVNFFKSVRMSAIASWQRWGPIGMLEIVVFVCVRFLLQGQVCLQ